MLNQKLLISIGNIVQGIEVVLNSTCHEQTVPALHMFIWYFKRHISKWSKKPSIDKTHEIQNQNEFD